MNIRTHWFPALIAASVVVCYAASLGLPAIDFDHGAQVGGGECDGWKVFVLAPRFAYLHPNLVR